MDVVVLFVHLLVGVMVVGVVLKVVLSLTPNGQPTYDWDVPDQCEELHIFLQQMQSWFNLSAMCICQALDAIVNCMHKYRYKEKDIYIKDHLYLQS